MVSRIIRLRPFVSDTADVELRMLDSGSLESKKHLQRIFNADGFTDKIRGVLVQFQYLACAFIPELVTEHGYFNASVVKEFVYAGTYVHCEAFVLDTMPHFLSILLLSNHVIVFGGSKYKFRAGY
jgi:hypothetical protein